jgi:hypothetical protein
MLLCDSHLNSSVDRFSRFFTVGAGGYRGFDEDMLIASDPIPVLSICLWLSLNTDEHGHNGRDGKV